MNQWRWLALTGLRLALATAFLSSVAGRLGLWGPYATGWAGFVKYTGSVNQHCGLATTGDETGCESGYCGRCRGRDRRPNPFWSLLPDREPGPDAEHCASAQRIVAFRRKVEEHVKESQFFTSVPRSRRKEST